MTQRGANTSVTVLAVGGTGESYPGDTRTAVTGMLSAVTDELDDRFAARWIPYPASYGPVPRLDGDCYRESVASGVAALRGAVEGAAAENPGGAIMLIGYSQGAVVIRALLGNPANEPLLPAITAVGFVADPHQPPDVVDSCAGWGVAGPGPELPGEIPAHWVGAADDVICNAGPDSLIRDVADLTGVLSVGRLRHWFGDMVGRVVGADLQNAARTRFSPAQWRRDVQRVASAVREVRGYLPSGGRHVSYSDEPYRSAPLTDPESTGCQVLAHWLQVQATLGARPAA
ncbi:MAG: PE-PPE domain-containing protein [Gordonia sp. (in: high G+C Gram-positive bacteria)]|uniref:cutinase family protein n=1 Tax=Gordonia sp. (in: high G+C Gram-positive bacteria) TaxID=84139 RepID=UPI003BB812EB